ncbi:MAG: hypothetical protein ABT940_02875 [Alphaproteobacteria bacterium]
MRTSRQRQRGVVLATVMVVMLLTMMIVSVLVNQYAEVESRAIEQLLWQTRFYWAMDGHANLFLSQAANQTNLCSTTCVSDVNRLTDTYNPPRNISLTRLPAAVDPATNAAAVLVWSYTAGGAAEKTFTTTLVSTSTIAGITTPNGVAKAPPGSAATDGKFFLLASTGGFSPFLWSTVFAASTQASLGVNGLQVEFCVGVPAGNIPTQCPGTSNTLTANSLLGRNLITNVTRPPMP